MFINYIGSQHNYYYYNYYIKCMRMHIYVHRINFKINKNAYIYMY